MSMWNGHRLALIFPIAGMAFLLHLGNHEPRSELHRLNDLANAEAQAVHRDVLGDAAEHLEPKERAELDDLAKRYTIKIVSMESVDQVRAERADYLRQHASAVDSDPE